MAVLPTNNQSYQDEQKVQERSFLEAGDTLFPPKGAELFRLWIVTAMEVIVRRAFEIEELILPKWDSCNCRPFSMLNHDCFKVSFLEA